MNILFLSQVFPDDGAPVHGTFNLALCRALAERHPLRVLAPRPWPTMVGRWLRRQGPVAPPTGPAGPSITAQYPIYWYLPKLWQHRSGRAMYRAVRGPLRTLAREFPPDVLLSYWLHPEGAAALEAARELGVPSVCIVGGSDVLLLPHRHPLRRREVVRVLRDSDAVIAISEGLRQACLNLGAPASRVHTIYQGIDTALFQPRDRQMARRRLRIPATIPTYLWVGRMVEVKRLELLLEAVATLKRQGERLKVYLLGDGPRRKSLEESARALRVHAAVDFVGPVAQDQLADWYSAVDATLLCSRSEGLPNVLRESLACGTPFVATDVGSIRELANPAHSLLVPPGDAAAFARAMQEIRQERFRLGASLHQPRTWSETAGEVAALCAALMATRLADLPIPRTESHGRDSLRVVPTEPESAADNILPRDERRELPRAASTSRMLEDRALVGPAHFQTGIAEGPPQDKEPFDIMEALNHRLLAGTGPKGLPESAQWEEQE